ncbi:MAG: LmeA family phospholipid-binding protein [Acidimicrobiales bacterium]
MADNAGAPSDPDRSEHRGEPDGSVPTALPAFPDAGEVVVRLLDIALQTLTRPPVRARSSPTSLLQGRIDVLVFEAHSLDVTGLLVDRIVVRAEGVRVAPGLPARLKADAVGLKATVSQKAVDRWVRRSGLPVRLRLTPDGVATQAGLGGVSLGAVTTHLHANGRFLGLKPVRASVLGVESPLVPPVPGFLPLPPLPAGAKLTRVDHGDGELTAWFDIGAIDEAITPDLPRRLSRRLSFPLPGLR